jgi:hypothetical protein
LALKNESRRLAGRQAQARQQQLAVLGIAQVAGVRNHDTGNGAQALDDLPRLVEPADMRVAGGENPIRVRMARILLDREEQFRNRLIEAPVPRARPRPPAYARGRAEGRLCSLARSLA